MRHKIKLDDVTYLYDDIEEGYTGRKEHHLYHAYYVNGKLHRDDGPAFIRFYAHGVNQYCYYQNDKLHREDGPAVIRYARVYKNGDKYKKAIFLQWWMNDEMKNPTGGPVSITLDDDDEIRTVRWNRSDKHSLILNTDQKDVYELQYRNERDQLHCDTGPAVFNYNPYKKTYSFCYHYIEGRYIPDEDYKRSVRFYKLNNFLNDESN